VFAARFRFLLAKRPHHDTGVEVLHPRGRVPLSLFIDDSTCLVNLAHYATPQFAEVWPERPEYQQFEVLPEFLSRPNDTGLPRRRRNDLPLALVVLNDLNRIGGTEALQGQPATGQGAPAITESLCNHSNLLDRFPTAPAGASMLIRAMRMNHLAEL